MYDTMIIGNDWCNDREFDLKFSCRVGPAREADTDGYYLKMGPEPWDEFFYTMDYEVTVLMEVV